MRLNNPAALYLKPKVKTDPLWDQVKEKYELGVTLRRPFEREWILNLAFLSGKHYVFFNTQSHTIQQLQKLRGRIRNIDNLILPKWRRQVADLIKNEPSMSVVPKTLEDEDIKAAKTADKVLKHFWREAKMQRKLRLLAGWIFSTGTCFLDDRWNERLGPVKVNPETGLPEFSGDVECSVWNPFEILVPCTTIGEDDHNSFPWLIKVKRRTLEDFADRYGSDGRRVPAERISMGSVDLNSILGTRTSEEVLKVPGAIEISYYEKPNPTNKRGLLISAANGVVLNKQDYPFNTYNLEVFKDIEIPGTFWGKATLNQALGLQRTWNRSISSIDEYNRVMAKGKGLVPRGANLSLLPDDTHGEWIEYTPVYGHKPEHMDLKGLPQTYPLIMEYTLKSVQDLFSQHEVSSGTNKSDIRSGEMVSLLREQDAHGNIPAHAVFEEALEAVMSRVLKRIQAGYNDERMLKIVGREGEFEIFAFKGADLQGNTDVLVKKQSSMPESRALRSAQVLERFTQGLYGNPQDPEIRRHVMNMMDDAVVKDIYDDTRLDESYSRHENQLLMEGGVDPVGIVNSYDNHALHLKEHSHFQKSMDYQKIKFTDPKLFGQLEAFFMAHKIRHQEFLDEQRAQMLSYQTAMEGKGGMSASAG